MAAYQNEVAESVYESTKKEPLGAKPQHEPAESAEKGRVYASGSQAQSFFTIREWAMPLSAKCDFEENWKILLHSAHSQHFQLVTCFYDLKIVREALEQRARAMPACFYVSY